MLIAQNAAADTAFAAIWLVAFVAYLANFVLVFFVIWSRRDWSIEWRIAATILMVVGLLLPMIAFVIYSVLDVVTRKATNGTTKGLWVAALIVTLGFATLPYFIWALLNKPQVDESPMPLSSPPTAPHDATPRTLNADDLDYLQKLTDLHAQGVLTDEQYEEQRNHRLGA